MGIEHIQVLPGRTSVHAQYSIMHDERDRVIAGLTKAGVPIAVHYPCPINRQPAYGHFDPDAATPAAERMSDRVFSLPMSAYLSADDQARVIDALAEAIRV
jgi:UDP-2-acetamido-2-deoxy-ribo-hexuluronate aminotransferase